MTRIAVLSDIHGNGTAFAAVLRDLESYSTSQAIDQVIIAGDAINWGPDNIDVMDHIVREGWAVIRGNQELYMIDQDTPRAPASWANFTISRWTRNQLGEKRIQKIATWPDALSLRFRDAPSVRVVHGSPRSHFEGLYEIMSDAEIAEILAGVEEETVLCGHTHLPMDRIAGKWHIFNSGTVGMPLNGLMESTYWVLDGDWSGWHGTLRRVPLDPEPPIRELQRLRFVEECGITAALVLEEYRTSRLRVHPFNQWRAKVETDGLSEDELLPRFLSEADFWDYTPQEYHLNR
jgi:predicted phosphodiesterase